VNHGQRLVAIFLKSCLKFYCEVLLVVMLAASQTLFASAKDSGNAVLGAVPPSKPDYLAAELQELDAGSVKSLGLDLGHALLIVLPAQNGPADRAGLRPGDVIVALNGKLAPSLDEFNDLITRAGSGAEVRLDIWRQRTKLTLPVRLGSASEETKAGSIEQRIDAYDAIAKIFDRNAFPILWALTQNNLGLAYGDRLQGSRAENIEAAIKAYQAALTILTRDAFPLSWAWTQNNLGLAYEARLQGSRAENIEAATKAHQAALTVLPREALPQEPAAENIGSAQMEAAATSEAQPSEEKAQPASQLAEASSPAPTETTSIPPLASRTPSASATAFSAPPLKAVDKQSPDAGTVRHGRYGYWHRPYRRHYGYWRRPYWRHYGYWRRRYWRHYAYWHRSYYRRWVYGYRHYGYHRYGRRW
jgi:tetratricopeptide (TPR) repeat protein